MNIDELLKVMDRAPLPVGFENEDGTTHTYTAEELELIASGWDACMEMIAFYSALAEQ